jgi:hypothetical protein
VRERLALLVRWGGARNSRVRAVVPKGTVVTYDTGIAAAQCEHVIAPRPERRCWAGGGPQLHFDPGKFDEAWVRQRSCTYVAENRLSNWQQCK